MLVLAFGISAGPASAYPCKPTGKTPVTSGVRTLTTLVQAEQLDCDPQPTARPAKRREADPMSFMFFIGILVAVVLVPVALGKREELPPQ